MKNDTKNIRNGITAILFAAVMIVSVLAVVPVVSATVTVYPKDRPGWESAVCVYEEEFFTDDILNPGVSVVSDLGHVESGVWWDRLVCPAYGLTTTTWHFAPPLVGFGGNWDPGIPGGPGANISVAVDGSWVSIGEIPNTYTGEFWGFVSTEPFSAVRLSNGSNCDGAWCETYELDNMVYSVNQPPNVTDAHPSIECLWPPNHKFVDITIEGVTDPDNDSVTITITNITSDEPTASIKGAGGATHAPDASGVGTDTASVRAERSGTGNGRVYEITFVASDGKCGKTEGSVTVCVPHDYRGKCVCGNIDDGQIYDATQINV